MKIGSNIIRIEHGHRIYPSFEDRYPSIFKNRISYVVGDYVTKLGTYLGGRIYLKLYSIMNFKMKKYKVNNMNNINYLIVGHSHYQEHDNIIGYINSGSINNRYIEYVSIEDNIMNIKKIYI